MKMFVKNKNVNKNIEINNKKDDEKKVETPIVTPEVPEDNKKDVTVEAPRPRVHKKKEPKTYCRVLMATPSYFIIDKNGEQITVEQKNSYVTGQEILY